MALGRKSIQRQQQFWIETDALPDIPRHVFYDKLNGLLDDGDFDGWLEDLCAPLYSEIGRKSIPPGVYFRMLLVGYFEEIDSQRAFGSVVRAWAFPQVPALLALRALSLFRTGVYVRIYFREFRRLSPQAKGNQVHFCEFTNRIFD